MLEIRLVGAVEVYVDGEMVAVPGRRVRALLVLLALTPGETVSTDALATGIWDDDPPERVRGSLQTYVGRVRRLLGSGAVETRPAGYALAADRRAVDLLRLWDDAQAVGESGDPEEARAALADVLRRWQGEPFGDAPSEWLDRYERPRWVERRLQTFERWVDLALEVGDHQSCLEDLARQVDLHPLREPLSVRHLTALDRAGRTAEALYRYELVRKRLAEELGADPSPELRSVYARLLERSDEYADGEIGDRPATVPRQLPAQIGGFVGRDEQLATMDEALRRFEDDPGGAVLALHGLAGSGKTALTVNWAHRVKERFPDGQLFVDLGGYGPGEPLSTERCLGALLRGLGVSGERIPDDVDERAAMLRSEVEGRRMLIVLDDARDSEQVRPLLPGSDVFVLVTSRTQLRGLAAREAAHRIRIDPMRPTEAVALLRRRLVGDVDEADLLEVAELCGYLPVALAVAAERIGRDAPGSHPVRAVIAELRDQKQRLPALSSADDDPLTNVRTVFEWSYRSLDDEAASVLRHLGLYSTSRIALGAIAALIGIDPSAARRQIDRLTDRHLLTAVGDDWYAIHDLVRDFAAEIASEVSESERCSAVRRLRSWFLHSAARARTVWSPPTVKVGLSTLEPGVTVEDSASTEQVFAWFEAHAPLLRRMVFECADVGDPTGHQLAALLVTYAQASGTDHATLRLFQRAEESAEALGDTRNQANCANAVGICCFNRDEVDGSVAALTRARDLFEAVGDIDGALQTQGNLAVGLGYAHRTDEAAAAFDKAIDDCRRLGRQAQLGANLFNASDFYLSLDRIDDAMRLGQEAIEVLESADAPHAYAMAVENLGDIQTATGRLTEAVATFDSALALFDRIHRRPDQVAALSKLGKVHRDLEDPSAARESWAAAVEMLDEMGTTEVREVNRAQLQQLLGSLDDPEG